MDRRTITFRFVATTTIKFLHQKRKAESGFNRLFSAAFRFPLSAFYNNALSCVSITVVVEFENVFLDKSLLLGVSGSHQLNLNLFDLLIPLGCYLSDQNFQVCVGI